MKFLNSTTFQVFHDLYEPWENQRKQATQGGETKGSYSEVETEEVTPSVAAKTLKAHRNGHRRNLTTHKPVTETGTQN